MFVCGVGGAGSIGVYNMYIGGPKSFFMFFSSEMLKVFLKGQNPNFLRRSNILHV